VKLFVTRADGNRVLEYNHKPAIEAYHEALGLDPASPSCAGEGLGPFSLFPLAHRSRDGRFHLLQPEEIGPTGMRFFGGSGGDRVLYPMKVPPSDSGARVPVTVRRSPIARWRRRSSAGTRACVTCRECCRRPISRGRPAGRDSSVAR
jgi:hypothetical protein